MFPEAISVMVLVLGDLKKSRGNSTIMSSTGHDIITIPTYRN